MAQLSTGQVDPQALIAPRKHGLGLAKGLLQTQNIVSQERRNKRSRTRKKSSRPWRGTGGSGGRSGKRARSQWEEAAKVGSSAPAHLSGSTSPRLAPRNLRRHLG